MKQYRSELDRLAFPAEGKEALVELLLQQDRAPEEARRRTRLGRAGRGLLLAACLTAALAAGALAVSPTLRDALSAALGSFQPYAQTPEDVRAVDGGIEIRLVSALMDETDGTAYLEVRDLEGDRLSRDLRLKLNLGGRQWEPIAYDAESKTALFAIDLAVPINEVRMGRAEELAITCKAVYPNRIELPREETPLLAGGAEYLWQHGIDIPKSLYANRVLKTRPLTEKEQEGIGSRENLAIPVLLPNQTPADLGSPYVSLSSAGFDENGHFHIQLALAEGIYTTDYGLSVDFCPGLWFESLDLDYILYRRTLLEGGRYYDVTFPDIPPEAWEVLPDATVTGYVYGQPPIEGEWTLAFPHVTQPSQEVTLGRAFGGLENITLENVQLTAMSLRLTFSGATDRRYMGGHPLHLFCKDGTILPLYNFDQNALYQNETGEMADGYTLTYGQIALGEDGWRYWGERDSWSYPRAVEPDDIAGFAWGLWYVPLDGGEGRWLRDLPQPTE